MFTNVNMLLLLNSVTYIHSPLVMLSYCEAQGMMNL